jgi:hypothetical protein
MTRADGRLERSILEALEAGPWSSCSTKVLATAVFGATPTATQRASLARAVRSLARKGRVVVTPADALHRRRQVRLAE